jgi:glycosyltransferase 2 family protein
MPRPAPPSEAPASAAPSRRHLKLALRIGGGLALLALVVWYSDPQALAHKLAGADPRWFMLGLALAIGANVVAAIRWAAIARALGMSAPIGRLILIYARGITTNMLLPGATLSGDLLRSYQLAALSNPFLRAALSVFFDRFSGLWVLCIMSLLAAAGMAVAGLTTAAALPAGLSGYILLLAGIASAPLIPWPTAWLRVIAVPVLARLADGLEALRSRLRGERAALLRSLWLSVAVQIFSAGTLWACSRGVGVELSYFSMLAAAAPIFIMAALPVGIAGFGTRELAAVLVLGFFGVPGDQATATALLYGLAAVVQGVLAAPLFLTKA